MSTLQFRLPGRADTLGGWLAKLLPGIDRATRRRWIEDARIRVEGRLIDRSGFDCPPGARVEIVDAPEEIRISHPAGVHRRWLGLIDDPPWRSGAIRITAEESLEFSVGERREGLARVRLEGSACDATTLGRALALAEMALVGDLEHGGLGVVGGVRLCVLDADESASIDWPDEPAWPSTDREPERRTLQVSDETARAIRSGHPWILPDESSDSAARFRPGTLVRVVSRRDAPLAWAHAEGAPKLAARVWARGDLGLKAVPSVEARVARAIARRRDLLVDVGQSGTNAFRLIHGEGDALPGFFVDRLGPLLRVLVTGRSSELVREQIVEALRQQLPVTPEGEAWSILELLHVRAAGRAQFDRVRWLSGGEEALAQSGLRLAHAGFEVLERGLRFGVDPGWQNPRRVRPGFGLFVDQRENRARLDAFAARGGAWLNLFAHTGAFSVSLLAGGAERVTSVDLSSAYLKRLEANLSANAARGVDPARHACVRGEGRRFLENLRADQRYSGIVLDPPTAAAAGRRFWSLQRDLEPLLRRCIEQLDDGGVLLVTQNRNGPPLGLDQILERLVARAHRTVDRLEAAPAGPDHPSRVGFPEGDPFEGWLLKLA